MRYIVTDEKDISLSDIVQALQAVDSYYSVADGDLKYDDDLYGQIDINGLGESLFEEELEELASELGDTSGKGKKKVEATLQNAKAIVVVQVLWQDRETEETLQRIDPLWEWLFANWRGLLQADGEGYYDTSGLILQVE
jgi:hypothetical protein